MNVIERFSDREPDGVTHAEIVAAMLSLANDLKQLRADAESGKFAAKITEVDQSRILKSTGQE